MKDLKRVLWISDYFPRPHAMTTGVWALETIFAIQKQGVEVVVLSPTPWIPRWLAFTPTLKEWSRVLYELKIKDEKKIEFFIHGKKLKGLYVLVKTNFGKSGKSWLLFKI